MRATTAMAHPRTPANQRAHAPCTPLLAQALQHSHNALLPPDAAMPRGHYLPRGITRCKLVGVGRFELPASSSRTTRANRAALHPVNHNGCKGMHFPPNAHKKRGRLRHPRSNTNALIPYLLARYLNLMKP